MIIKKDCNKNDIQAAIDIYISDNIESFDPINWEMFDLFFIKNETIISTARSELVVNICSRMTSTFQVRNDSKIHVYAILPIFDNIQISKKF